MLDSGRLWAQFRRQLSFRSNKIRESVCQWRPDGALRNLLRLWLLHLLCKLTRCLSPLICKFGRGLLCSSFHGCGLLSGSPLGCSSLGDSPLGGS